MYIPLQATLPTSSSGLPAYYIIALSEASSNLSRYDGIRYGLRPQAPQDTRDSMLTCRGDGLGSEVKRRILMGTYALSSGYYDAYYKKAQQVRMCLDTALQTITAGFLSQFVPKYSGLCLFFFYYIMLLVYLMQPQTRTVLVSH